MPGDDLTPSESAILVALMAVAREISNTELKERYHIDVRKGYRDKLNRLRYVESRKSGRTYLHQLADRGWARVEQDLPLDARGARALGGALTLLLANLRDRIAPRDDYRSFGELFALTDLRATAPPTSGPQVLRTRLRQAYAALATGPGEWVGLTRLRPFFGDVDVDDLDEALRRLEREPDVNIVPESNQKMLTPQDVAAAVRIGGQDKHLLAIGV
ncbi:hypothetical protein AWW66_27120 [Micromonospora rosaria]|uniref:Uncharacterized protein n=1 Tax=Micromonospora rosaria TaxID=47874 RepID=A0A136PKI2_9ACTN|nr:hypothetical protein [Micromonospora rosaria]KXK58915.1 hypothetical protein AWW66_27120 [Micromonospora rosaria]